MTSASMADAVIAIDLGGTQLRCAIVQDDVIRERWNAVTPRDPQAVVEAVLAHIDQARRWAAGRIEAIGVSALGPIEADTGLIRNAPTIPGFDAVPIRQLIESHVDLPVLVVNDANAAAYAEWRLGAGAGTRNFCFITVSTGIGSGFIVDGRLVTGGHGLAGELGRLRVRRPGERTAQRLETYASGTAIAVRAASLAEEGHVGLRRARDAEGVVTAKAVASLAAAGDRVCQEILTEAGTLVGEELADVCRLLDPEVIAVGGGVSQSGPDFIEPMRRTLSASLIEDGCEVPRLVTGQLQDGAGLRGAALLANELLLEKGPT